MSSSRAPPTRQDQSGSVVPQIDLQNEDGITALMWAALHDHTDAVKVLLAKGANAKIKSKTGKTAVEIAKDPAIIELLKAAAD